MQPTRPVASLYRAEAHAAQTCVPSAAVADASPLAHCAQFACFAEPAVEDVPTEHAMQVLIEVAPAVVENLPTWHAVQLVAPAVEYLPAVHTLHWCFCLVPSGPNVPALQCGGGTPRLHEVAPYAEPQTQDLQLLAPNLPPLLHWSWYRPLAQVEQVRQKRLELEQRLY